MSRRLLSVLVLLVLLVAGLGAAVARGEPAAPDLAASEAIRSPETTPTHGFLAAVSLLFHRPWTWVTLAVVVLAVGVLRGPRRGLFVLLAFVVAAGLIWAGKTTFDRTRPNGGQGSYPSGHVTYAAALAGATAWALSRPGRRRVALLAAALFVALMAWSRVGLGAHWASDVIGGALLGTAAWLGVLAVVAAPGTGPPESPVPPPRVGTSLRIPPTAV